MTEQETDPDLPVSVQESLVEAWVGSGLLQGRGHYVAIRRGEGPQMKLCRDSRCSLANSAAKLRSESDLAQGKSGEET